MLLTSKERNALCIGVADKVAGDGIADKIEAVVGTNLTSDQITAMSPELGQIVFNTTTSKHQGWDGSTWNDLY